MPARRPSGEVGQENMTVTRTGGRAIVVRTAGSRFPRDEALWAFGPRAADFRLTGVPSRGRNPAAVVLTAAHATTSARAVLLREGGQGRTEVSGRRGLTAPGSSSRASTAPAAAAPPSWREAEPEERGRSHSGPFPHRVIRHGPLGGPTCVGILFETAAGASSPMRRLGRLDHTPGRRPPQTTSASSPRSGTRQIDICWATRNQRREFPAITRSERVVRLKAVRQAESRQAPGPRARLVVASKRAPDAAGDRRRPSRPAPPKGRPSSGPLDAKNRHKSAPEPRVTSTWPDDGDPAGPIFDLDDHPARAGQLDPLHRQPGASRVGAERGSPTRDNRRCRGGSAGDTVIISALSVPGGTSLRGPRMIPAPPSSGAGGSLAPSQKTADVPRSGHAGRRGGSCARLIGLRPTAANLDPNQPASYRMQSAPRALEPAGDPGRRAADRRERASVVEAPENGRCGIGRQKTVGAPGVHVRRRGSRMWRISEVALRGPPDARRGPVCDSSCDHVPPRKRGQTAPARPGADSCGGFGAAGTSRPTRCAAEDRGRSCAKGIDDQVTEDQAAAGATARRRRFSSSTTAPARGLMILPGGW